MNQSIVYSRWSIVKTLSFCLFAAVLLIFSFPRFNFEILAWFGFVPLFFALNNKSKLKSFFLSYLTGVIFWSGIIYWLVHVTLPGTVSLILYLALYFGIFGLFFRKYSIPNTPAARQAGQYSILLLPSLWVILEYLRSFLFSGFGWAVLGYSQYLNLWAIQIADITGVWGVSFMAMMVNVLIYEVVTVILRDIRNRQRPSLPIAHYLLTFCLVFLFFGYGYYKLKQTEDKDSGAPIKISVIQANIPQELKWRVSAKGFILDKYINLSRQASLQNPDLIIWPEAAVPGFLYQDEDNWIFQDIFNLAEALKTNLLIGSVVVDNTDYHNSALMIEPGERIIKRYDKLHLVPFGEYIPLRRILRFLETVVPIGDITPGSEYKLFSVSNSKLKMKNSFAVLVCFEDIFPKLSQRFVKKGADFLVNITNDAWYKQTSAPFQHLGASVFRAVENRRFLVRAANTGVSGFISPHGTVMPLVSADSGKSIFVEGFKTEVIYGRNVISFYTRYPDIFVLLCLFFTLYGIIIPKLSK